jgi:hypothetical protein
MTKSVKRMPKKDLLEQYLRKKDQEYERLCLRCGACCGALEPDPCAHLKKDEKGKYFCEIYPERLGLRKTVRGKFFLCVPIKKILDRSWSGSYNCIYKKLKNSYIFLQ